MAKPAAVTDSTFEADVLKSTQPVLIDFWAEWCGPCRMIAPFVEQIANEYEGKLKVLKLDVDSNQGIAMEYGIQGIPTLLLFKGGREVERIVGYQPKDRLLSRIKPHVS